MIYLDDPKNDRDVCDLWFWLTCLRKFEVQFNSYVAEINAHCLLQVNGLGCSCITDPVDSEMELKKKIWHDDVIKWKHFPRRWPFVWEIHRSSVNSPHKGQWRGALIFKNTKTHTAHTIVSWPNPKQWVIVHTSDLMMIIRQRIYISSQSSQGNE